MSGGRLGARALLGGALAAAALGCPGRAPAELEPAPDCSSVEPGDPATLPPRELAIGTLEDDESFRPWAEGEELELIIGFQGAAMIIPYIELPVAPQGGDADPSCWLVTLDLEDAEGSKDRLYRDGLQFSRVGEVMRTGPVFGPIEDPFWGRPATLSVVVTSEGFSARQDLGVVVGEP